MVARGARATVDVRTDAQLAVEAAEGSSDAFEEIYRRHSEAAWRVAYAVTGNAHDAADAVSDAFTRVLQALPAGRLADASLVRSYVLTATRNAAIDVSRRAGRVQVTDRLDHFDDGSKVATPTDAVARSEDASIVTRAFRSLPERWRSVLWLTEVEGVSPKDAAVVLGVTPNNAAQLAVRARAGLRERFVQAHLSGPVESECKYTVERLGAYVTARLSPRELAKVDQHLAGCASCTRRRDELEDVGGVLRRIALPLPLLLGSTALTQWKLTSATGTAVAREIGSTLSSPSRWADAVARVQKPLLAVTTGIFAVGVIIAAPDVLGAGPGGRPGVGARLPLGEQAQATPAPAVVPEVRFVNAAVTSFTSALNDALANAELTPATDPTAAAPTLTLPPTAVPPAAPTGDAPQEPPADVGVVAVGVAAVAGPITFGAVAGDACQGGSFGDQSLGDCDQPEPESTTAGVTITTGGTLPIAGQSITIGI